MTDDTTNQEQNRVAADCPNERLVMRDEVFKKEWLKTSEYPSDFIPAGGQIFIGVDPASPDGDCTVKGFYKDGEFHIQEIEYSKDA